MKKEGLENQRRRSKCLKNINNLIHVLVDVSESDSQIFEILFLRISLRIRRDLAKFLKVSVFSKFLLHKARQPK